MKLSEIPQYARALQVNLIYKHSQNIQKTCLVTEIMLSKILVLYLATSKVYKVAPMSASMC